MQSQGILPLPKEEVLGIRLFRTVEQSSGGKYTSALMRRLLDMQVTTRGKKLATQEQLRALLKNQDAIPESWRPFSIGFWGNENVYCLLYQPGASPAWQAIPVDLDNVQWEAGTPTAIMEK